MVPIGAGSDSNAPSSMDTPTSIGAPVTSSATYVRAVPLPNRAASPYSRFAVGSVAIEDESTPPALRASALMQAAADKASSDPRTARRYDMTGILTVIVRFV